MRFAAINAGPPLSAEDIEAYLSDNALAVPPALRLQLLDQNGGAPADDVLVDVDGRDEEVMSFFGIGMSEKSSELAWVASTFADRLPDGVLAFADDPAGNLFVVETGDRDRVWFWDHESSGDRSSLSPVADTFSAFMASLDVGDP